MSFKSPMFIPEFREMSISWTPGTAEKILEAVARGEKCCLEGLTEGEELTVLYALGQWYPDEFREFCRKALDACTVVQLEAIRMKYELLQLQEEARMRRVMRGIQLAWSSEEN